MRVLGWGLWGRALHAMLLGRRQTTRGLLVLEGGLRPRELLRRYVAQEVVHSVILEAVLRLGLIGTLFLPTKLLDGSGRLNMLLA